jgi:hypothetical protein
MIVPFSPFKLSKETVESLVTSIKSKLGAVVPNDNIFEGVLAIFYILIDL